MNNFIRKVFVCVLLFISTQSVKASYDFAVNDLYYKIKSLEERTCILTNSSGNAATSYYRGNIVVPSSVNFNGSSFKVVEIDAYAFNQCDVTSVTIPNTINKIGYMAFYMCESLTSVKLPNTPLTISDKAFAGCTSLIAIRLPEQLRYIGKLAFERCPLHGQYIIPKSCGYIDHGAFADTKISTIIIPHPGGRNEDDNSYIGDNCFYPADSIYIGTNIGIYINYTALEDFKAPFFRREYLKTSLYFFRNVTFGDSVLFMPGMEEVSLEIPMKKLTIGYNIQHVPLMPNHIKGVIYMRNSNPPLADGFTERTYVNAVLYVPRGSKSAYQSAYTWKRFINIQEYDLKLPSSVREFNKRVQIDGHECVEINGLYWRTKNVGASSPYDTGWDIQTSLKDSLKVWETKGWRLPTNEELKRIFCTWPGNGHTQSVHRHYFKFFICRQTPSLCFPYFK